jgi:CheY-like chemotaxis protein
LSLPIALSDFYRESLACFLRSIFVIKMDNKHLNISSPDKGTVLIVDDDATSREALAHLLQTLGYRSSQAENGLQALKQPEAAISPPELILLDLEMPVMNGREFLSHLAHLQCIARPIVIIITGQDPRGVAGAAAVLRKPVSISQLLGLMQDLTRSQTV